MNEPRDNDRTPSGNDQPGGEDRFAAEAKALFDDSVERLDAATLARLNQRRQAALAEVADARPAQAWLRWMPAGALAAAAVAAVMLMQGPGDRDLPQMPDTAATDVEILLGDEQFEMFEDLEFYSWIEIADEDPSDNVG